MKGKYLLITANILEFACNDNFISVDVYSISEKNNKDSKYDPSRVVVLCVCILNNQR